MAQPQRWWVGLLLLVPFWLVVGIKLIPKYEQDVAQRAIPAIAASSKQVIDPKITVSGRDVLISGTQIAPEGGPSAVAAAEAVPGVRLAVQDLAALAAQKPYVFGAERDGSKLTLTGFVPSVAAREKINAAAKTAAGPKGSVEDKMSFASGAGAGFEAQALFGVGLAGQLTSGAYGLSDDIASLTGSTPDSATYEKLRAAMNAVPAGGKTGKVALTPPSAQSYVFSAAHNDTQMVLSGTVPNLAMQASLNSAAKSVPGVTNVEDKLTFASGAPANFDDLAKAGIGLAGALKAGLFSYRNGVADLSGQAPDSATYARVRAAMKSLPGGAREGDVRVVPPPVANYLFTAGHDGKTITLGGKVPSADVRQRLVEAATKTGNQVKDELSYASGADANFENYVSLGIRAAASLGNSQFSLSGSTFDLSGDAASNAIYNSVRRDVANFPRDMRPGRVDIRPPVAKPFVWRAERNGEEIKLSGVVPDEAVRAEIERRVKELFPTARVTNSLVVARGAPKLNFAAASRFGLQQLANLSEGAATLTDDVLSVLGKAPDHSRGELARGLTADKLPQGLRLGQITVTSPPAPVAIPLPPPAPVVVPPPPPPAPAPVVVPAPPPPPPVVDVCQPGSTGSIASASVYFPSGRHEMLAQSRSDLARIIEKAKACGKAALSLRGHADARGDRRSNLKLSTRRTFAVQRQLIRAGIDRKRVVTLGYGEDRPTSDNRTFQGRAQNRRVEVILK